MKEKMNGEIPQSEREVLECFRDPKFKIKNGHIVELDLSKYFFKSLPENFGNLNSLKILNLRSNDITILPESFGNLKSLESLNLEDNLLTSLPECIGNLKSLKFLNLEYNKLTFLPESIGNLSLLNELVLQGNKFTYFPESLGNLISLEFVYFEFNLLTSLPENIGNLKSLKLLDLNSNPFKTLSNFTLNMLKEIIFNPIYLTIKGKRLYKERKYEDLLEYYRKTPKKLTLEYISDPNSLTEDELERLIQEVGINEINFLENHLSLEDPILKKLVERNYLELSNGSKIYL